MHEISAENLLLQSDVADYHGELTELRTEAKELRAKCYELIEDNRLSKAEVRDLRRYIDLQKANKSGGLFELDRLKISSFGSLSCLVDLCLRLSIA